MELSSSSNCLTTKNRSDQTSSIRTFLSIVDIFTGIEMEKIE